MGNEYRMAELTQRTNVTKRTVHYYINKGLIPSAQGMGINSYYTDEHLYRILLVKKLQDNYLPLDKIQQIMAGISLEEIMEKLDGTELFKVEEQDMKLGYPTEFSLDERVGEAEVKEILRYDIGKGIELNVSKDIHRGNPYLVESAVRYLKRIINEG